MEDSKYCFANKIKTSVKSCNGSNQNASSNKIGFHKRKHQTCSGFSSSHMENISTSQKSHSLKKKKISDAQYLPVYNCKQQILNEIRKSDILLIMGETGSGKTTQIPQFLLNDEISENGLIGVTQPRRVAAITVAKRVAQEIGCALGDTVGYTVRFEDCTSLNTKIKFLTDGCLLREAVKDRLLLKYKVVMLDEAHERSINTDVLFGIVKSAQVIRKQRNLGILKVIITSATMDIDHFSHYFGVRGMYLEGRVHPIRVMHTKQCQSDDLNTALITLFDFHRNSPTNEDVLIFLAGQEEIEIMARQIRQIVKTNTDLPAVRVFPLYAQLPQNKQLECFLPSTPNNRKIILATNIAETSITIPGIRCVIDCGFVKRRIFNSLNGLDVLRRVRISQAEAWQRCGRAGRDASGICYRTYTVMEMKCFERMVQPEILRSNICSVILNLLALGTDFRTFNFLDAPSPESINYAYQKLMTLGAIKSEVHPSLSNLGMQMSQFPLDPRYSKIILSAPAMGCLEEILSIISMLSCENVFLTTPGIRETASLIHTKFLSKDGDLITLLNVYKAFERIDKFKLWCHDNFLNTRNLLYAREVRKQLVDICKRMHLRFNSTCTNYEAIKKCLLYGFFDNVATLQPDKTYLTLSTRQRAKLHPSSAYNNFYKPEYVIYNDIIFTDQSYLRQITEISKEWISDMTSNFPENNVKTLTHPN